MNLPNSPKRSFADDELDQLLNAWTQRHSDSAEEFSRGEQFNSSTTDALEFHRWADDTLRSEPAAKGPAAGTWNRVLHHVEQKSPRGTAAMSATTAESVSNSTNPHTYQSGNRREMSLSRFANIAATVAIVFAVSVGGWFAMSQLPPGGDGRFAALQASPEVAQSGTCDVEPLTVDEVIAIVENPYSVLPEGTVATPPPDSPYATLGSDGLQEDTDQFYMPNQMTGVPTEDESAAIKAAADRYEACWTYGTVGQVMAVTHPRQLQDYVLGNFPVYRDEGSVREFLEDVIDQPAVTATSQFRQTTEQWRPNYQSFFATSERTRIRTAPYGGPDFLINKVAKVGLDFKDKDGTVVGATDWDATILEGDLESTSGGISIIMVYVESIDTWYYYAANTPRG